MRLIAFIDVAGQRAFEELQTVFVPSGGAVPSGPYAFLEHYCVDAECDCQRAILSVVRHDAPGLVLATLGFEWERTGSGRVEPERATRDHEFAILTLEPSAPQSTHAPALLELFRQLVRSEPAFVERLRRHYAESRSARGVGATDHEPVAPAGCDSSDQRVKRQFPKEGFLLLVDSDGLEVRVIDYHARPLVLAWSELERLRGEASRGPEAPPRPGGRRKPGKGLGSPPASGRPRRERGGTP